MFFADASSDIGLQGYPQTVVPVDEPRILARGPWPAERVSVRWRPEGFAGGPEREAKADAAITALRERGSPAHDGMAARLAGYAAGGGGLELVLQPMRWALRLVRGDAADALSVLCVARDREGRWLAGRRAAWVATWAGRWALGAGGAVEVDEDPVEALGRELEEEWGVAPAELTVEALISLPGGLAMLIGQAQVPEGAELVRDAEHDAHAWWPADPSAWPAEAEPELRRLARLLDE
jgi:8-oxo-dGTP diphosphatase